MDTQPGQTIVYEISDAAFGDAIEIREIIELLQRKNDEVIRSNLRENDAGLASSIVQNALLTRLVLLVSRAFAKPRQTDLHIGRAFLLLQDEAVLAEIETRVPFLPVTDVMALWLKLKSDHRLPIIVHFRDKFTAHLGQPHPDISLPEYQQLFDFAREASNLMSALAMATGARSENVDTWDGEAKQSAEAFWSPWDDPSDNL
jgi:hypothetical protein